MGILERPLPARGVKLYFIVEQNIPEGERASWQNAVSRSVPLSKWFERVEFQYSDHPTLISDWQGWNLVKIFCTSTRTLVKPSKAKSSYQEMLEEFSTWFVRFCQDRGMKCRPYDFRVLFRLHPPEKPGEFVPIPSLEDAAERVVSPPSIISVPDPPTTPEEMMNFARMTDVLGEQALGAVIQYAAEHGWNVYASYGIRTEEDANTYELDTLVPSELPREADSVRSLQGELSYDLILQSEQQAPLDLGNVVEALLMKLVHCGVIDRQKVEQICSSPDDYFEAGQCGTRFVLRFDPRKYGSDCGGALDAAKKQVQRELNGTKYQLYGAVSYTLTDEDVARIETVIEDVIYFRNARRDDLFIKMSIILFDSSYERIVEIAERTDEILHSHNIIDLDKSPSIETDIDDAKKRWTSALSDLARDGKTLTAFVFIRVIRGVPLQVFTRVQQSLYKELNEAAAGTRITTTITSDNQQSFMYGCYVC